MSFEDVGNHPDLGRYDFVLVEGVLIDVDGDRGIKPENLISSSLEILNERGNLMIKTNTYDVGESNFPNVDGFVELLRGNGFSVEVKRSEPVHIKGSDNKTNKIYRSVTYYSKKA